MEADPATLEAADRADTTVDSSLESLPPSALGGVARFANEFSCAGTPASVREDCDLVATNLDAPVRFRTGPMPSDPEGAQIVHKHAEAIQYLEALFEPEDLISMRMIESWTENGQKESLFKDAGQL